MDKVIKKTNMISIAFDNESINLIDQNKIAWSKMIERSIISKVEHIFLALKWDMSEIKPIKFKKERIKKCLK
jgi:hypothetical protein